MFADLTWNQVWIALILILIVRPVSGWLSLAGTDIPRQDRAAIAVYGVRGIGSIYYLCYAMNHMEFVNESQLWSLVGLIILLSTILHGFSVSWAMRKIET